MSAPAGGTTAVCVVGAGPQGTSVLERLVAWAAHQPDDRQLVVHVVDPFPPGPGRIWRREQSGLLWMNSTVGDVRMFVAPETAVLGPAGAVPSFAEWLATVAPHELTGELADLAARMTERSFAPRPLVGEYYSWVFDRIVVTAPDRVRVVVHRARATDVVDEPDGRQRVALDDGTGLVVDQVVLAQGNFESRATAEERGLAEFAGRHGLRYLPSGYFDGPALEEVPAGEPVIMRGFGLTFIDCMALLCEGRGGRFEPDPEHGLTYRPSGREPVLHVGSRRGLPYHAKFRYDLPAGPPPLPRFFTADAARALGTPLEFRRDLWPLVSKEIAAAYYHELFRAHPERTRCGWPEFSAALAELDWGSPAWEERVAAAVPAESDRFRWDLLDRRFDGRGEDAESLQRTVRQYIADDLEHRGDPAFSPELAAVRGLLSTVEVLFELVEAGDVEARSLVREVEAEFLPLMSFVTSGPPPRRLAELHALSRAGVVRFLGPGTDVVADPDRGCFRARSAVAEVEARCLVESRLREPTLAEADDALLRRLHGRGECTAETLVGADGVRWSTGRISARASDHRLLHADGRAHPRRFAVGPYVAAVGAPAPDPAAAGFFGTSDLVARSVLGLAPAPAELSAR